MSNVAQNLCFLLWQQQQPRHLWAGQVARLANCDIARSVALLKGDLPTLGELQSLATGLGLPEEDLQFSDLLADSRLSIWQENVLHLLSTIQRGEHGTVAEALGVTPSTLSKWKKREHVPERTHRAKLQQVFELHSIDLDTEPLFLSPTPADLVGRRQWLCERIQTIDGKTLQLLFPALERLLSEP